MNLPPISCVCVTCARVHPLQNAIHDFVSQKYEGVKELVVLNTCPLQTLEFIWPHGNATFPNLRIINLDKRPESLGQARNMAIEQAKGDIIVTWDDDDSYLPHHLQTIADGFSQVKADRSPPLDPTKSAVDWIWLDKQFWGWGNTIKDIVKGQCPCFAFTKRAWQGVGGYPGGLSVAEDRTFISNVTQRYAGNYHRITGTPSFVYRWSNGVYHLSGQGDDKPELPKAYDRYWADVRRRMDCGIEPMGKVTLIPVPPEANWVKLAESYMGRQAQKKTRMIPDVCIVQLGRFGDCINVLPIAQHIAERYAKPHWMISKEFASLLDGVSYVIPHVVDFQPQQLQKAIAIARQEYRLILSTQIYGSEHMEHFTTESYNKESWRVSGFLHKFNDFSMRPVFDLRSVEREKSLISKLSYRSKPLILVNVTNSISSPFEYGQLLLTIVQQWYGKKYHVVDLGNLKFERVYDVLGLMDNAAALISIDTCFLHLACASDVPTLAIVNPSRWLGTIMRRSDNVEVMNYNEVMTIPEFKNRLDRVLRMKRVPLPPVTRIKTPPANRRMIHVSNYFKDTDPHEAERKAHAQASWKAIYAQGVESRYLSDTYPRSSLNFGDKRNLPFVKDILMLGLQGANDDDIIFITNNDTWLRPDIVDVLRFQVSVYGACCSQRREFKRCHIPVGLPTPEDYVRISDSHPGRDLFAFTARWLRDHWEQIGDYCFGSSDWDWCMAAMLRLDYGIRTDRTNLEEHIFPAEIPLGYVCHQFHIPAWASKEHDGIAPSQIRNRKLFKEWATVHLPELQFKPGNVI